MTRKPSKFDRIPNERIWNVSKGFM